jgi:hypothetical protein
MTELPPTRADCRVESAASDQIDTAVVVTDVAPNSPAQDALRQAIIELDAVSRELDEALKPAQRLSSAVAELEGAERELTELRVRDNAALAAWLAGSAEDPRPEPSPKTLDAECRIARLNRDGAAARTALPAVEARLQGLAERVRTLHRERDEAAYWAAVDAARACARRWRDRIVGALREEAILRSLHNELVAIGNLGDGVTAALGAANVIVDLINDTKRSAAVPHDQESGRRLMAALMTDPSAAL